MEQAIYSALTVDGEPHGILFVTGRGLTEADVPAVTAFANQAAIAIENARLFELMSRCTSPVSSPLRVRGTCGIITA